MEMESRRTWPEDWRKRRAGVGCMAAYQWADFRGSRHVADPCGVLRHHLG